jgi:tetratricopeptide (TPR) repeat protein
LTYFEQAIALQPDYVDAHAGLADALGTLAFSGALPHEDAFERARAHAATALELAPRSAQARSSMAMINLFADRQPILAAEVLSELLLEDPNNERLLLAMANVRWAQGCHVNAISVMSQASRVDPHSPIMRSGLALSHYLAGDYAEARAQALIVLDAEPAYAHAVFIAAMSAALMGDHHDALQLLDQGGGDELVSARGYVLAASGDERAAAELLHRPWGRRAYLARARLYAAIGRWAEASNEVETAVESREPSALLVRRYPTLREIPLADSVEAELDRLDGDCI